MKDARRNETRRRTGQESKPNGNPGRTSWRHRKMRSTSPRANSTCCRRNTSSAPPPCMRMPATDYATPAQWDKEDADYKQKIADKQKAVDDAKQKLDDLEEEARKAGVPAAMREP